MQVKELKAKYEKLQEFLKFSLKNNEKKCYMQPNAKYFCLFFSNNFKKLLMQMNAILEQFD